MKLKSIFLIILFISIPSIAQESLTNLSWEIGLPTSKMGQYMGKESYRGFGLDFKKFLTKNTSVGLSIGWNLFDQRLDESINLSTENISGTVSGTQIRYINTFPILVNCNYYIGKRNDLRTFIGLGAGMYYVLQRLDIGVYRIDSKNWHIGIAPEGGLLIPVFDSGTTFLAAVRYNYAFDAGKSIGGNENNFYSYWSIRLGISISNRWY